MSCTLGKGWEKMQWSQKAGNLGGDAIPLQQPPTLQEHLTPSADFHGSEQSISFQRNISLMLNPKSADL